MFLKKNIKIIIIVIIIIIMIWFLCKVTLFKIDNKENSNSNNVIWKSVDNDKILNNIQSAIDKNNLNNLSDKNTKIEKLIEKIKNKKKLTYNELLFLTGQDLTKNKDFNIIDKYIKSIKPSIEHVEVDKLKKRGDWYFFDLKIYYKNLLNNGFIINKLYITDNVSKKNYIGDKYNITAYPNNYNIEKTRWYIRARFYSENNKKWLLLLKHNIKKTELNITINYIWKKYNYFLYNN